jgi:hypothetical protein
MNPLYAMLPNSNNHEDYQEDTFFYINNYLNNSLGYQNKNRKTIGYEGSFEKNLDKNTEYSFNNFGFRDNNWFGESEILAVGCSNTCGIGVPIDGSWTKILEKKINKDVRNLSRPGASIQELIYQTFAYFKTFGNPKTIICLFPDPFRMLAPTKKNMVGVKDIGNDQGVVSLHLNSFTNSKVSERKKLLKMPYIYDDIMPMEFPLFLSMKSIHMLEQYCYSNNIKLVWSSWHADLLNVLNRLNDNNFSNFLYNEEFLTTNNYTDCHKEYKQMFSEYFDSGMDIEIGTEYAHPGVHWHSHVADAFYKEINK